MRVPLNEWGWQNRADVDRRDVIFFLEEYVKIDTKSSIIHIDPVMCPLPGNYLYSYLVNMFNDSLEMMEFVVPMTAQTPEMYTINEPWRLASDNRMAGLYFMPGGPDGITVWGESSAERGSRYVFDFEVPRVFIGDYILHKNTIVEPLSNSGHCYR